MSKDEIEDSALSDPNELKKLKSQLGTSSYLQAVQAIALVEIADDLKGIRKILQNSEDDVPKDGQNE